MKASTMRNTFVAKRSAKVSGKGKRVLQTKLTKHWREPTQYHSPVVLLTKPVQAWSPRMKAALGL